MIDKIFKELDREVAATNRELREQSSLEIPRFFIKILGQTALIEAKLDLTLFATLDVDAYANFSSYAKALFSKVLQKHGLFYDELSNEIWMPQETEYLLMFKGQSFDGYIAKPEFVLVSKLLKARDRNRNIIIEYLAKGPSALFLKLCKAYKVNLEEFVKGE